MNRKSVIANFLKSVFDVIEDLVAIAIAVGILLFGWFVDSAVFQDNPLLWSGVISILIVMAVGNLRDRRSRFQKIHQSVDRTLQEILGSKIITTMGADDFFRGGLEKIEGKLLHATTIDLAGITLSTTAGTTLKLIKDRLKANGKVRIIILDSNSDAALEQLVKQSWSKRASKEKYIAMIENVSDLFEEVSNEPGIRGSFEVGYLPFIPSVGMTLVDTKKDGGVGIVKVYQQLKKGSRLFYFSKHDAPETFEFYCEQFNLMWAECRTNKVKKIV
ncbi:MAG: hypothetical protein QY306_01045 [Anaerolineales bacterium]|nr:MAG: hypothetical protein QY306_01045 [Anaerolineales bacterium]